MSHEHSPRVVHADQLVVGERSAIDRLLWIALAVGVLGAVASLLLAGSDRAHFFHSWLVSFLFWTSIALGGLFFVLLQHATKAGWGIVVRRLAENTSGVLPIMALLFVPVALGIHELYEWSHAEEVAHDHLLQGKAPYLNSGFFIGRSVLYFAVWCGLALWFLRTSSRQDATGDQALSRRMIAVSGPAILAFALTVTFAAFDWIMSLSPHWYSTIFGVYYFSGCLVGIFGFLVLTSAGLQRVGLLREVITVEHFHDLGKLLFAFTVFWTYIAFAQYFLIWYGNIPEETIWFAQRNHGSWATATLILGFGHFGLPFFFLMPRTIKRRLPLLVVGACWMLVMHLLDMYWLVMPTLFPEGPSIGLVDILTFVGIGGLFMGSYLWLVRRHALVPVGDPRLAESLGFENV